MVGTDESSSFRDAVQTPHELPFNPNKKTLVWQRLETMRLQKLGLTNRYSRHFNVLRQSQTREKTQLPFELTCVVTPGDAKKGLKDGDLHKNNSLAPFATVGKPTCGYFFTDHTANKKSKFGIPPSDLVKWRNFPAQST